jgi:hypothetical protein
MPTEGVTGVNPAAVRYFIEEWKKQVGNWSDIGEVQVCAPWSTDDPNWCGMVDVIPDDLETQLVVRIVSMVYTLVNEILTHVKVHAFNQEFFIATEGVMNLTEDEVANKAKRGEESVGAVFNGSDRIFEWVDTLVRKEKWFEQDMGVIDLGWDVKIDVLPDDAIRTLVRQGMALGIGLAEITMSTGEARLLGRWFNLMMDQAEEPVEVVGGRRLSNEHLNEAVAAVPCSCGVMTHNEFIAAFANETAERGLGGMTAMTPTLKAAAWTAWRANCGCDEIDPFIKALPCECSNITESMFIALYPHQSPGCSNCSEAFATWKLWCGCGPDDHRKYAEEQVKVLIATMGGVNDSSFVDHFVHKWMERHGSSIQFGQMEIWGNKFDIFHDEWEIFLYKKMVGAFTMLVHKALAVDLEIPFLFEEKLRLSSVETEMDMTTVAFFHNGTLLELNDTVNAAMNGTGRRLDSQQDGPLHPHRRLKETPDQGYGTVNKYVTAALVDPESVDLFLDEFFETYPDMKEKGDIGGIEMCDPFGCLNTSDQSGCVFVDLVDDKSLLSRLTALLATFLSSGLMLTETRIFHQRLYAALSTQDATAKAFGAYLRADATKIQVEHVKLWVESRFDSVLNDHLAEFQEKIQTWQIGEKRIEVLPTLDIKEFFVKALVVPLMYVEMLVQDVRVELMGRTYKMFPVLEEKAEGRRLLDRALQSEPRVDWEFADQFIEEFWNTYGARYVSLPPVEIKLEPLFHIRAEVTHEWEKFLYKAFFGIALDLINAQIEQMNFNLPLPLARQALSMVPNPNAKGTTGTGGALKVPPLTDMLHLSFCFHGSEWLKCALPHINPIIQTALAEIDPKEKLDDNVHKIDEKIPAINANAKCRIQLGELAGFSKLAIKDLVATVDWRCGLGEYCHVCFVGKACGNNCIGADEPCFIDYGCAINAMDAPVDVSINGRTLKTDGTFMEYCRLCVQGKACGNTCIGVDETCSSDPGCAADRADVVCKVCTGGRKKCKDSCIAADAVCAETESGCARDASEVKDIDLMATGGSAKGHVSIVPDSEDSLVSLDIQITCEADFCGDIPKNESSSCCENEEQHLGLCYRTCAKSTANQYPWRMLPCTCGMDTSCKEDEELFGIGDAGLCYKKCSLLTDGSHTERWLPSTCAMNTYCQEGEEEHLGLCYRECSSFTGGSHPRRQLPNVCGREAECRDDQEKHCVGFICLCYKKCSILTSGSHPHRSLPTTCTKSNRCADNEEEHLGLCYKKCSILTNGDRPLRTAACTCSISSKCRSGYNDCGLHCNRDSCWKFWSDKQHLIYDPWTDFSFCTDGQGGVANLPYDPWTDLIKFTESTPLHDPWMDGFGCNGFGKSVDGGCANLPYDPWVKGTAITCNGFAVSGEGGCGAVSFRPQTSCSQYGTAGNGGLPHFPTIQPTTLNAKVKVYGLKASSGFDIQLDPKKMHIQALTLENLDIQWSDVRVHIEELGVFNAVLEPLVSAAGWAVGNFFSKTFNQEIQNLLNKEFSEKVVKDINNKELRWDKILSPVKSELAKANVQMGNRRLGASEKLEVIPGVSYMRHKDGSLQPKQFLDCHDPKAASCPNPTAERKRAESFMDPVLVRQLTQVTSLTAVEAANLTKVNPFAMYQLSSGYYSLYPNEQPANADAPLAVVVVDPHPTGLPHWNTTVWSTLEMTFTVKGVSYSLVRTQVSTYVELTQAVTKAFAEYAGVEVSHAVALPEGAPNDAVRFRAQVGLAQSQEAATAERMKSQAAALPAKVQQAVLSILAIVAVQATPGEAITVEVEQFASVDETVNLRTPAPPTPPPEPSTPGPTPVPTPAPPATSEKKVKINFKIANVNYAAMSEDMKRVTKEKIAIGIAADTPGVSASDVEVTLSAGSLVVEATITPP